MMVPLHGAQRPRLIVAGLIICLTSACLPFGRGPGATIKAFLRAVEQGKTETALALVGRTSRSALGDEKLTLAIGQGPATFAKDGGISRVVIESEEIRGDTATVAVRTVFGNGTEERDDETLIREDGRWRVVISK